MTVITLSDDEGHPVPPSRISTFGKSNIMPATLIQPTPHTHEVNLEPVISILLPFDPKITPKEVLTSRLDSATMQAKDELDRHYQREETYTLMVRLRKLISRLNYGTYKKSVAIYLSADTEKVFYLDMEVENRVSVDGPFTMRDLVQSKKDARNYLLLLLSGERINVFHGNAGGFKRLLSITPDNIGAFKNNLPGRVANFSDPSSVKETLLDKFLRYADHALTMLLVNYPFPVIVMATERTGGHFKKVSGNDSHIMAYVHGNFEEASQSSLRQSVAPCLEQWEKLMQQQLLKQLDNAMGAGRLAIGVRDVNAAASLQKGRLLVMERNFKYKVGMPDELEKSTRPFYLQDRADEAIAKVLESGGEVEFVEDGALNQYKHIALVKYY
jgi:hypothetical protein